MEHRPPGGRPAGAGIGGGGDLHRCSGKPLETMGRKATELRPMGVHSWGEASP